MKTRTTTKRSNQGTFLKIAIIIAILGVLTPVILRTCSNKEEKQKIEIPSPTVSTNEFVETHEEEIGILDNVLLSDTIPPEVESLALAIQSNAGDLTIRQRQRYAICCLNAQSSAYYKGGKLKTADGSISISRENLRIAKSVWQKYSTPTEWEEFCQERYITSKTVISSAQKQKEGFAIVLLETFEFDGSTHHLYYYEDELDKSSNLVCKKLHTYD